MDFLEIVFPVSGVKTYIFIPPLVAFVITFFTSMSGVSGAFLLLPFQMSFLNYTAPSVSATNLVFNIAATPSGVYGYIKERRMAWALAGTVVFGTLPGVFVGYYIRVVYLPDPKAFKLFVGCVLLYIGAHLLLDVIRKSKAKKANNDAIDKKFKELKNNVLSSGIPSHAEVKTISVRPFRSEYDFWGERFFFNTTVLFLFAFFVGIIGGTYGIGGGSIIAPFCVAFLHLPVYTIAGATLLGTFMTSVSGLFFYSSVPINTGLNASPDWLLGLLFGAGGLAGMYLGARYQKVVPQKFLKLLLGLLIIFVAIKYIFHYLR